MLLNVLLNDKTFRHRNFGGLGFNLFIVINKKLLERFGLNNIGLLEGILAQIFRSHREFIEDGMVVGIRIFPKEIFQGGAAFRLGKDLKLKKCFLQMNVDYFLRSPNRAYISLVHELTHWHDKVMRIRFDKTHMVSEQQEINLLSMILHGLRTEGLANFKMFYAKASQQGLFDKNPHKITLKQGPRIRWGYVSAVRKLKVKILRFKKILIKSQTPGDDIFKWVMGEIKESRWIFGQYTRFYFLGSMMCYLILFMHMINHRQEKYILIYLDKNFQEKIDVRNLRYYLDRTELYIGKVPLRIFNYTYEIIRNLRPAEFFILYLDACKLLGLYHDNFLIFEDVDIELITKHKNEIDKDIV
jgi:hypothetical protein